MIIINRYYSVKYNRINHLTIEGNDRMITCNQINLINMQIHIFLWKKGKKKKHL